MKKKRTFGYWFLNNSFFLSFSNKITQHNSIKWGQRHTVLSEHRIWNQKHIKVQNVITTIFYFLYSLFNPNMNETNVFPYFSIYSYGFFLLLCDTICAHPQMDLHTRFDHFKRTLKNYLFRNPPHDYIIFFQNQKVKVTQRTCVRHLFLCNIQL